MINRDLNLIMGCKSKLANKYDKLIMSIKFHTKLQSPQPNVTEVFTTLSIQIYSLYYTPQKEHLKKRTTPVKMDNDTNL